MKIIPFSAFNTHAPEALASQWQFFKKRIMASGAMALILLLSVLSCVPLAQQGSNPAGNNDAYYRDKTMRTSDFMYEESIKTVLLYPQPAPGADAAAATLQPPVLPLAQPIPLILEFDELSNTFKNYRAKIYHCNADWSVSLLTDIDFLDQINDFLFNQPQLSFNTKIAYVHYTFEVPRVKLPGNYLLMVYREGNVKDIILTKRFMIYENRVQITATVKPSTGVQERNRNQQIDFAVAYRDYPLTNPRETVKVSLRQNYKWNNAITTLAPLAVREDQALLEYNYFNLENNFPGGNEYRFFDMRSIRFLGMNMAKINPKQDSTQVLLVPDKTRTKEAYSQMVDLNGRFAIDNYETGRGATEADYVNVHFTLRLPERAPGNVHLWGEFMNWNPTSVTQMRYDEASQSYKGEYLLKQGFYNYAYALEPSQSRTINETYFEGSHFNTENHYEVIVYYRPLASRADMIIGYALLRHNSQR
jgi:hypothetical protein